MARLEHIASDVSLDQGYISRLEAGQHNPTLTTLWLVAEALAVPLAELVRDRATVRQKSQSLPVGAEIGAETQTNPNKSIKTKT